MPRLVRWSVWGRGWRGLPRGLPVVPSPCPAGLPDAGAAARRPPPIQPSLAPHARRGAAITAIVFGLLHLLDRRRTLVSAAWATGVGAAYGALYLNTGNVADAALAHALSNVASGLGYKLGPARAPGGPE